MTRKNRLAATIAAGVLALLALAGCPGSSSGCTNEGERVPAGTIRETGDRSVFETCGKDGRWHRVENPDKGPSGTRAEGR